MKRHNKSLSSEEKPEIKNPLIISARAEVGKNYRILIKSDDSFMTLMSLEVLKDGSIVVVQHGKSKTPKWSKSGVINTSRKGQKIIKLTNLPEQEAGNNPGKVTFHPSGVINFSDGERKARDPLRTMYLTQQLLTYIYPGLSKLQRVPVTRKTDIIASIPAKKYTNLQLRLTVSPPSRVLLQEFVNPSTKAILQLEFKTDTIQHSEKAYIVHIFFDFNAVPINKKDNDAPTVALYITLSDEVTPDKLKPRTQ